jgi:hypothetical protein
VTQHRGVTPLLHSSVCSPLPRVALGVAQALARVAQALARRAGPETPKARRATRA